MQLVVVLGGVATGSILLAGWSHVPGAPLWARASLRTASLPAVPPGCGGPHGGCVVAQELARRPGVACVLGSCCRVPARSSASSERLWQIASVPVEPPLRGRPHGGWAKRYNVGQGVTTPSVQRVCGSCVAQRCVTDMGTAWGATVQEVPKAVPDALVQWRHRHHDRAARRCYGPLVSEMASPCRSSFRCGSGVASHTVASLWTLCCTAVISAVDSCRLSCCVQLLAAHDTAPVGLLIRERLALPATQWRHTWQLHSREQPLARQLRRSSIPAGAWVS